MSRRFPTKVSVSAKDLETANVPDVALRRDAEGVAHVAAFSGGKDSTAMIDELLRRDPDLPLNIICTPTGNELPEMEAHWAACEARWGLTILRLTNGTLETWIDHWKMLPNWRARWCTRKLKLVPMALLARSHPDVVMYVGLRADEPERGGIFDEDIVSRHPLREWGWGIEEVVGHLRKQGIRIPKRTDCALCFFQQLPEWHALWREHPALWDLGERLEAQTGHTFRSDGRDTWPASLRGLRERFEAGHLPRGVKPGQWGHPMLPFGDLDAWEARETWDGPCRVCSM